MQTSSKTNNNKTVFKVITILIPFIILIGVEGILRITNYGDDFSLFIQNSEEGYERYMMLNPEVGKKYFQKLEYTKPGNDIFLKKKPENAFRVFVLGSSTVIGFPYDNNIMFSRILNTQLNEAFPDKKIEIINTAITAINSFTLLDYTDQILDHEPDAILIYAGHNEFYGAFGVGSNETMSKKRNLTLMHIALMDFKVYQLLRNIITSLIQKTVANEQISIEGTLMKRIVNNNNIRFGSEEYFLGIENYKANVGNILKKISDKKIPVFISEVVCNVKGIEPFSSVDDDSFELAIDVFREAQIEENNHNFEKAKELYYKAKDLDGVRFRASEDINQIINELAVKYDAILVPMLSIFQENSPNDLIGNNLMTEHVHPNIEGNFIMADAFFSEILASGIIGEPLLSQRFTKEYVKQNYGFTILDSLLAQHRVQMLKGNWPFVNFGEEINYMKIYQPKNYLDTITFEVVKDETTSLGTIRYQLAHEYEDKGEYIKAYKEYEAFLRTNPYIPKIYRDAGTALMNLSDMPKALSYFQQSLEFEESGYAYLQMAEIYFIMANYSQSAVYFQKALPLISDSNKRLAMLKIYTCLLYDNQIDKVNDIEKKLHEMGINNYKNIPEKEYIFNQFIPFQTRDEILLAQELINEDRNKEALQLLESSLNLYDSHVANRLIGQIYVKLNNVEAALFYYEKIYEWYQFEPRFLYELALIYNTLGQTEKANQCVDKFIEIDPTNRNLEQLKFLISKP